MPNNQPFEKEIDITDFLIENRAYLRRAADMETLAHQIQDAVALDDDWQVMTDEGQSVRSAAESSEQRILSTLQNYREKTPAVFRIWHVGERVLPNHPDYAGKKAIIYEVYYRSNDEYGISLLTEDGQNLGGWEPLTWRFLEYDLDRGMAYTFTDVMQLSQDVADGLFDAYFMMEY